MIPTFDNYQQGYGAELICPSCGSTTLHHESVEVFERGEDAAHGLHVTVDNGKATIDSSLQRNPSGRRQGLTIQFWCEQCDAKPVLAMQQHKGNTYIDFRYSPLVEPGSKGSDQ